MTTTAILFMVLFNSSIITAITISLRILIKGEKRKNKTSKDENNV